jgi:surfeit locus 1 family protein
MRCGCLEFSPGLWPTVITLLVFGVLLSLGFWQLDRAAQKQLLLTEFEQGARQAPFRLDGRIRSFEGHQYELATASGWYDSDHQLLLDNRTHQGQAGYQVLTPLRLADDGPAVLVNRGWVPIGQGRDQLPDVRLPTGLRAVTGRLQLPSAQGFRLGQEQPRRIWPYRILHLDYQQLQAELGYELLPVLLLLNPDEEDGYVREWHPLHFGPERSTGYAVQWFSMAAALAIIYLAVNLHRRQ